MKAHLPLTLLLSTAAAAASVVVTPRDVLELRAGGHALQAVYSPKEIRGDRIRLERSAGSLQGKVMGSPVMLAWSPSQVHGQVGRHPIHLQLAKKRQGLWVTGAFAGQSSELSIEPTSIRGRMGGCTYELELAGETYLGFRTCNGPVVPIPASVRLPRGLERAEDGETVALLALLLANELAVGQLRPEMGPLGPDADSPLRQ